MMVNYDAEEVITYLRLYDRFKTAVESLRRSNATTLNDVSREFIIQDCKLALDIPVEITQHVAAFKSDLDYLAERGINIFE